jgi:hypothetical protein
MKIIAIKPAYDIESRTLQAFFEDVISAINEKEDIELIDLNGCYSKVSNILENLCHLKSGSNKVICFYGHGNKESLLGWERVPLFHNGNIGIAEGWHFYTVSCHSILSIGRQSITKGCLSFIGYKNKFIIGNVKNRIIKGLKESVNKGIVISTESQNYNVISVYNAIMSEFEYWINYHSEVLNITFNSSKKGDFGVFIKGLANIDSCSFSKYVLTYNKELLDYEPKIIEYVQEN